MPSNRVLQSREGFTLIEVLVAMIILAVGLLGLEALGIGAARSIAIASRKSEFAVIAAGALERKQQEIRRNAATVPTGESCTVDAATGFAVCTTVQTRSTLGTLPAQTARVTVRVVHSGVRADTFIVASNVFDPALP